VPRASFLGELRSVLAERDFRRLFATRLVSQTGDGMFTAGVGAYVFFNRTTFPDPATAASAFAVLYLPYSLVGPFAGVFIDRWSRRQILVWSALLRAVLVVLTASLVATGSLGLPLYVAVLGVLGVNRFFLSSLSAALPHVVAGDKLVMANSVAPTAGTIVSFLGGLAGLGVHLATGGGRGGSAATLLAGGAGYLLAGAAAATMPRGLLGPPARPGGRTRPSLAAELLNMARGLAHGARHVWQRRPAAAALGATGSQRAMYGILLLTSILLYRNYFYAKSAANSSLAHFTLVVVASAAGYGAAALLTPVVTRRLPTWGWISVLLAAGAVLTGALGPTFTQPAFLAIAFGLGVVAQGVAICGTTILQQEIGDAYRGRVFALYDMLFNVPFVIGAAAVAQVIPDSGKSAPVVLVAAAGYLLAALAYTLVSRRHPPAPGGAAAVPAGDARAATPASAQPARGPAGGPPPSPDRPSPAAHRRSS
jgi:MFS family permease